MGFKMPLAGTIAHDLGIEFGEALWRADALMTVVK